MCTCMFLHSPKMLWSSQTEAGCLIINTDDDRTSNVINYFAIGKIFSKIVMEIYCNRDRFVNANLSRLLFVISVRKQFYINEITRKLT